MGVQDLLAMVRTHGRRQVNASVLAGDTLGIDLSIWLVSIVKGDDYLSALLHVKPEPSILDAMRSYLRSKVDFFTRKNIKLVAVLDGQGHPAKKETADARKATRTKALEEMQKIIDEKKDSQREKLIGLRKVAAHPNNHVLACAVTVLRELNVPIVQAPWEADWQLVYMRKENMIQGIIAEDSDYILFNALPLITQVRWSKGRNNHDANIEIVGRDDVARMRDFYGENVSSDDFNDMCIFQGCDYCPRAPHIGPKTLQGSDYSTFWFKANAQVRAAILTNIENYGTWHVVVHGVKIKQLLTADYREPTERERFYDVATAQGLVGSTIAVWYWSDGIVYADGKIVSYNVERDVFVVEYVEYPGQHEENLRHTPWWVYDPPTRHGPPRKHSPPWWVYSDKPHNIQPMPNFKARFERAQVQFSHPYVLKWEPATMDAFALAATVFTLGAIGVSQENLHIAEGALGYPCELNPPLPVALATDANNAMSRVARAGISVRTFQSFENDLIALPMFDGVTVPSCAILDFTACPPVFHDTRVLLAWLGSRSIRMLSTAKHTDVVERVKQCILRDVKPLPHVSQIGVGHYTAAAVLLADDQAGPPVTYTNALLHGLQELPPLDDDYVNKVFNLPTIGPRNGVRERALRCLKRGSYNLKTLKKRLLLVNMDDSPKPALVYSIDCTASMKADVYTVHLFWTRPSEGVAAQFLPTPCSRCMCPHGTFFCSHMLGFLLVLSILQSNRMDSSATVLQRFPEPIKNFQSMPAAVAAFFGDVYK